MNELKNITKSYIDGDNKNIILSNIDIKFYNSTINTIIGHKNKHKRPTKLK